MIARRSLIIVLFLTVITSIVFIARYGDSVEVRAVADKGWERIHQGIDKIKAQKTGGSSSSSSTQGCEEDLTWLEAYDLPFAINYVSRDIITKPKAEGERSLLTKLDEPLFEDFQLLDTTKLKTAKIKKCLPPLTLEVPHGVPKVADASNMIFGLQTTIGRLRDTVKHLNRWLPHTGARLFCIVKEDQETLAKQEEMHALEEEFQKLGMNVTIIHPVHENDRFEQRYFSLVNVMYEARDHKTEWIVTIDDDTFFPSLNRLQEELSYHDSSKPQYISALSENWWAVDHYGLMGFGGASIILSVPLVKTMYEHQHECNDDPSTSSGDVTVMECIYRFSITKLTNVPELYQLDIKGDLSGFFESGRPVLSMHHWKEGPEKIEIEKTHLVADICDDCFLQRWQFQDGLILSNGYTIHTYPQGHLVGPIDQPFALGMGNATLNATKDIKKIDLLQMEETWDEHFDVRHSLDPLREKLDVNAKVQYKILDSMVVIRDGKNCVRQVYWRQGVAGKDEPADVLVLTWIPGDSGLRVKEETRKKAKVQRRWSGESGSSRRRRRT